MQMAELARSLRATCYRYHQQMTNPHCRCSALLARALDRFQWSGSWDSSYLTIEILAGLLLNKCIPPDLSSIPGLIISPLCPVLSGIRENNTLVTHCLCICNLCLCVSVTVFVFVFCIRLYSIFGPHVLVRPVSCSVRMKLFPNCFSSPPPRPKPRACPSKSPGTAITHHTH